MYEILRREFIYLWYYFSVQLEQIFLYWVIGMLIGSAVSVFLKDRIHNTFRSLGEKKLGVFGIAAASVLGIASPLCMYGTIPLLQGWLMDGMSMGSAAAFMITGPATKITNLGALKIVLGVKRFAIYIAYVIIFSLVSGIIINLIV